MHPTHFDLESLARQAGEILLAGFGQEHEIGYKGLLDLVTEMDHRSEEILIRAIRERFPADQIVTEESGNLAGESANRWFIDPRDGTINYAHGLPFFCVSLGYADSQGLRLGAVFDPVHAECFSAERGQGAWLNGEPIRVTENLDITHSLLVTGFAPNAFELTHKNLELFGRMIEITQGVRRLGSAALDLCYVACGRVDGYWETKLNAWDLAAGTLIAAEAGAVVTDLSGRPEYMRPPYDLLVSNPGLHPQLLAVLNR
jgi:myo-inositol-1(or 4)-monophosphatase